MRHFGFCVGGQECEQAMYLELLGCLVLDHETLGLLGCRTYESRADRDQRPRMRAGVIFRVTALPGLEIGVRSDQGGPEMRAGAILQNPKGLMICSPGIPVLVSAAAARIPGTPRQTLKVS